MIVVNLIFLLGLFFLISKAADLVIVHARILAKNFGMNIFLLGIILGLVTSTPELFIGINSVLQGIGQLSYGNLIGGLFVLLALICGLSVILNREIKLEHSFSLQELLLVGLFLILPMILSFNGNLNFTDGLIIVFFYLFLTYLIFHSFHKVHLQVTVAREVKLTKSLFFIIIGILGVIFCSKLIISITLYFINTFKVPIFLTGLLVFSLGTNLPEIILSLRAWFKKIKSLSLGNIIGSAIANSLVIGIISLIKNINININISFYILFILLILLILFFINFALSERKFTRPEGVILIVLYLLFFISQMLYNFIL